MEPKPKYRLVYRQNTEEQDSSHSHQLLSSTIDDGNCIISQFDPETDLGLATQGDALNSVYSEVDVNVNTDINHPVNVTDDDDMIFQLMDIRVPLSRLKSMLEQRTGQNLSHCEFWLQNSKMLEGHLTLVDQCIRGSGLVQVNIKLAPEINRIVIADVLKPDEDLLQSGRQNVLLYEEVLIKNLDLKSSDTVITTEIEPVPEEQEAVSNVEVKENPNKTPMKWVVDEQFLKTQKKMNIPDDPNFWTIDHVKVWIQWAVRHFNLPRVSFKDWSITGADLCALTREDFQEKVPHDPCDLFWTHIELLRRCKFIAVVQKESQEIVEEESHDNSLSPIAIRKKPKLMAPVTDIKNTSPSGSSMMGNRLGNNGQIQLWQFLLELLTSTEYTKVIQWIGTEGEFRLQDPEFVAHLWGLRKHKPTMNYEKLSRALRYYYDGDMISKVQGKRFVYRFVCNLKDLIGYDAGDLARLVNNASNKENSNNFDTCS